MTSSTSNRKVLVIGVGNTLLQDDGVGVHVAEALRCAGGEQGHVTYIDGGTIGLPLLPSVENADALIIVDAAELNAPAGTIRVFQGNDIEQQMNGRKRTVHEVAMSDLLHAAALRGTCPQQRAMVAIQPACTELGLRPTAAVQAAIPAACAAVAELTRKYQHAT